MNYFKLKLTTQWCGTNNEELIMTGLTREELESEYGKYFDDLSRDNLESYMDEEECEEEGYSIEEGCGWHIEEVEFDDEMGTFTIYE